MIFIDRFRCEAEVDMGFQIVDRNCPADQFQPPLEMAPGDIYEYERDTCGHVWPGVYGNAIVRPLYKKYTVAGEYEITDIDPNATGPLEIEILEGLTNPDLKVVNLRLNPESPEDGDIITVEFDVKNAGDRLAGTAGFRIWLDDGAERNNSLPQNRARPDCDDSVRVGRAPFGCLPDLLLDRPEQLHPRVE